LILSTIWCHWQTWPIVHETVNMMIVLLPGKSLRDRCGTKLWTWWWGRYRTASSPARPSQPHYDLSCQIWHICRRTFANEGNNAISVEDMRSFLQSAAEMKIITVYVSHSSEWLQLIVAFFGCPFETVPWGRSRVEEVNGRRSFLIGIFRSFSLMKSSVRILLHLILWCHIGCWWWKSNHWQKTTSSRSYHCPPLVRSCSLVLSLQQICQLAWYRFKGWLCWILQNVL